MVQVAEEREIVIVGGGICGLATALALHRKGIRSLVLESAGHLRAAGATITIRTNGWRALDYLGIGSRLRKNTVTLQGLRQINLDKGTQTETPLSKGEARCIKRTDLIDALASDLPHGTIRYGCHVLSIRMDPLTSLPLIQLQDGSLLKAKMIIGCDGVKSVVLDYLGMNPTKVSSTSAVRGFTIYPNGHTFDHVFTLVESGHTFLGAVPVNENLVYWFITRLWTPEDAQISKHQDLIKLSSLRAVKSFPKEMIEIIERSDKSSLSSMRFRYRSPWDLLFGSFRKGTVTVAGDALHAMSPFIGQGGASSLEDAITLARCLANKLSEVDESEGEKNQTRKYEEAIAHFVEERRMRLIGLVTLSYIYNKLAEVPSMITRILCILVLVIFFRDPVAHTGFDCRPL